MTDIGRALGCDRGAVARKISRLGIGDRARVAPRRVIERPAPKPLPPPPRPVAVALVVATGPIGDFPPSGHCRYIAGELTAKFQCCGAPTGDVLEPWCGAHRAICFQPARKNPISGGDKSQRKVFG